MAKNAYSYLQRCKYSFMFIFQKKNDQNFFETFCEYVKVFHSSRNTYGQFWRDILVSVSFKKIKHNLKSWSVATEIRIFCLYVGIDSGYAHEKFWSRLLI